MSWLLSMFNQYGIKKVHVQASPLGGMSKKNRDSECNRLVNWYRRFGFVVVGFYGPDEFVANAEMEMKLCR